MQALAAESGPNFVSLGLLPGAALPVLGTGATRRDILAWGQGDGTNAQFSQFKHDLPVTTETIFQITGGAGTLAGVLFTFVS